MIRSNLLRIGFLADTHDEHYSLMRRAVSHMGGIDYLLHLGDFLNNFGTKAGPEAYNPYRTAARKLSEIQAEFDLKGVYVIPGNHEVAHPERGLCELEEFSIHEKVIEIEGHRFLGYGGGYDFALLNGWQAYDDRRYKCDSERLEGLLTKDIDILLLHQLESKDPAKGSLKPLIERVKPRIVLSGHKHRHIVGFDEQTMYASCGPIWPLDGKRPKVMGKSSFGILEIENYEARVKLYFFKKNGSEDLVEWDGEIGINFNNH